MSTRDAVDEDGISGGDDMYSDPPFGCSSVIEVLGGRFACGGTPGHAGEHSFQASGRGTLPKITMEWTTEQAAESIVARAPHAARELLCDNKPVMDALGMALSDPGSITPRAPMESLTSWQRRAVIEHAVPLIIAARGPQPAPGERAALREIVDLLEWANNNDDESLSIQHVLNLARNGLKPHAEPGGPDLRPRPGERGWFDVTCGSCGEEFGTNFRVEEIECAECEARRCPNCATWFGGDL